MTLSRRTLLGAAIAAAQANAQRQATPAKPNIIVILFDDLGVTDLGHLWPAAEKLSGVPIDPLAPEIIAAFEAADG